MTCGVASVSSRLPNTTSVCTFHCNFDSDRLAYKAILYINNTLWTNATYGSWFQWNETLQISTTTPYDNHQAGLHQIGVKLDDSITTPLWINYTQQVIPDWPLVAKTTLPNLYAIVDNKFWFDYNKFDLFWNPQDDMRNNITMYFTQKDANPPTLPYFLNFFPNGTLYGMGVVADIATYQLQCVAYNEANWMTSIDFTLTVQRKTRPYEAFSLLFHLLWLLEH